MVHEEYLTFYPDSKTKLRQIWKTVLTEYETRTLNYKVVKSSVGWESLRFKLVS